MRHHGDFPGRGGDAPDGTALFEAAGHLDPGVDGEHAWLAGVVDHDVVLGAGALFAQQRPDLVERLDDVGAQPPGCRDRADSRQHPGAGLLDAYLIRHAADAITPLIVSRGERTRYHR